MNRLLAISDIHGCFDTFYELVIRQIKLDKTDKLILLGDYIDRGDKSKEVIDLIIDLTEKGFNVIPLMGNHESMLVDSFIDNSTLPLWFMNSGESTLESFSINDIRQLEDKYMNFFRNLKYYYCSEKYVFVHAGFNNSAQDPFKDTQTMIWECQASYNNPMLSERIIIHGHRPKTIDFVKKKIALNSEVIPIDTGCVYNKEMGYGFLSALEVNSMQLLSVERSE